MAIKNENRAADSRDTPHSRAMAIVLPEREMPGVMASPWIHPSRMACAIPTSDVPPWCPKEGLNNHSNAPVIKSAMPTIQGVEKKCSNVDSNSRPITAVGTLASTNSKPKRRAEARSESFPGMPWRGLSQAAKRLYTSWRYMARTAARVAMCTKRSKINAGS